MSDPRLLQVHLNENGSIEIAPHPSATKRDIYAVFRNVEINNWRFPGGDADQAGWTTREIEIHADDEDPADEGKEGTG